jgi:rhamnose transport system permease protein
MKYIKAILLSRQAGLLGVLLVVCLYFGHQNDFFSDPFNLLDRSRFWVEIGLIAVPMTFIIATSGIDLSAGSLATLCGIVGGLCYRDLHWPFPMALAACVVTGLAGGAINGLAVSVLRIPSLVATLATLSLYQGLAMGLAKANPIRNLPAWFNNWGSVGAFTIGGYPIPQQTVLMLVVFVIGMILFRKTVAGRWAMQLGENATASRFAAVPVAAVNFWLFTLCGLACGLASITYSAHFANAHPEVGKGLEFEAITCVVIGGTRITGGSGTVLGTLLGLLLVGLLRYGMEMQGAISQQHQIILIGLLLIVTAIFNEWMARRRERRARPVATTLTVEGEAA